MSSKHNDCKIEVTIEQLIEETESAGNRTRWATVALVVATVLIGIGFYNSTEGSFANERLKSLKAFENIPVNNSTQGNKFLLDSYFGKNDFNNTKFKLGLLDINQSEQFDGLKRFICDDIYKSFEYKETKPAPDKDLKEKQVHQAAEVGKYLYQKFNKKIQDQITAECRPDSKISFSFNDETNFKYFTADLNRILYEKYLYDENRFDKSLFDKIELENQQELVNLIAAWTGKPEKSNQSVMESEQNKVDIVRLNRLLLEAAFPNEILPSKDIVPDSESLKAKELAKNIAYDEKVQFLQIPFFYSAIDVNDLGVFGGIGLIIILLLLRFSLSREIKNLNFSFRQAFYQAKLDSFYHLLAMRQVLTIPEMAGETKNQMLSAGTKWIYILPFVVIGLGVFYDYYSIFHYHVYDYHFVLTHLIVETLCVIVVLYLSFRCMERQVHIDEIWEDYNQILNYYKKNQVKVTKIVDKNSGNFEVISSEFCREIKESPKELYEKAMNSQKNNMSDGEKAVAYIFKKRLIDESASDGFWLNNLLYRQNIARLIPIGRISAIISESTLNLFLFLLIIILLIASIGIFIERWLVYGIENVGAIAYTYILISMLILFWTAIVNWIKGKEK